MRSALGTIEALAQEDPVGARTLMGCPRLVGKPRVASLLVRSRYEQQHGVGKKGLGKRC
jgi:hypothetical protein